MSDPDLSLRAFFTQDHRRCDEIWSEVEATLQAGDSDL